MSDVTFSSRAYGMVAPWPLDDGRMIYLLTPTGFRHVKKGQRLVNILGEVKIKGKDEIDMDTRMGFLSIGLEDRPQ